MRSTENTRWRRNTCTTNNGQFRRLLSNIPFRLPTRPGRVSTEILSPNSSFHTTRISSDVTPSNASGDFGNLGHCIRLVESGKEKRPSIPHKKEIGPHLVPNDNIGVGEKIQNYSFHVPTVQQPTKGLNMRQRERKASINGYLSSAICPYQGHAVKLFISLHIDWRIPEKDR